MIGLLADQNMPGQAELIWSVFSPADWQGLGVEALYQFDGIGLARSANDRDVWLACQSRSLLLLTDNRNAEGADALGRVIEELNDSRSFPILTVARLQRVNEFAYRENLAYSIADVAQRIESLLGSGRLFIP